MKRRESIEIFGASMLDMMTCGFGAVLLLFIVQRSVVGDRTESLKRQIATAEEITQAIAPSRPDDGHRASNVRSSSSGPRGLRVPLASSPLVVLVDQSRSMVSHGFGKLAAAARLLEALLGAPEGATRVTVVGFGEVPRVIVPWESASEDRIAWARSVADRIRDGFDPSTRGDLVKGLLEGVTLLDQIGERGRILVVSDAGQNTAASAPADSETAITLIEDRAEACGLVRGSLHIDAVMLANWPRRDLSPDSPEDLTRIKAVLQSRKNAGGGDFSARSIESLMRLEAWDWGIDPDALGFFRFEPKPELGQQLLDISRAFGGRFIATPVDPFPESD